MSGSGLCECGCGRRTKIATRSRTRTGHVKGQPLRFVVGHGCKGHKVAPEVRFWSQVNKNGPISPYCPELGPCWVWEGLRTVDEGYGRFYIGRRDGEYIGELAHRYAWELEHGPIPADKQVQHICNFPPCVRHLALGTQADNMEWMSECERGSQHWHFHKMTPEHRAKIGRKGETNPAYRPDISTPELARRYTEGESLATIAAALNCSQKLISNRLREFGIRMRPKGRATPVRGANNPSFRHDITTSQIAELYATGLSGYEVAERLGCGNTLVYRRLQHAGVLRRSQVAA